MRRFSTLSTLLIVGLLVGACGAEDMDDTAPSDMAIASSDRPECYLQRGTMAEALERPSPLRETPFSVGGHDALLCYGAPSARSRKIMDGLLVYGQPERIGANEPTTIHLTGAATVAGVELQPGSYSIYAIPGPAEWVFFVNSSWQRWGIPIDDAVRASEIGTFTAKPELMDEYVETLQYRFEPMENNTMGDIVLEWENTRVRFHVHPSM